MKDKSRKIKKIKEKQKNKEYGKIYHEFILLLKIFI